MLSIRPVILSGGAGTRLWPISTSDLPKQFAPILPGRSLFERTLMRLESMEEAAPPLVVTGSAHLDLVKLAVDSTGVHPDLMIIEPAGRNTAPASIAAAVASPPDEVLVILPSDHLIRDEENFRARVRDAAKLAREGHIVTFGVVPDRAETGYGYIEQGDAVGGGFEVRRFKEKPSPEDAALLFRDGNHFWNSGIFVVPAGLLIEETARHAGSVLEGVRSAWRQPENGVVLLDDSFSGVEKISLDHAVMEKTRVALVVPIDVGWDDVGSFHALWAASEKDGSGNVVSGDVVATDVSGSLIMAGSRRVAVVGLDDIVVIETPDAVLVVPRESSQRVREIVDVPDTRASPAGDSSSDS